MNGADEARELHLLEFVVDEVADGGCEFETRGAGGERVPVDVDGHYMIVVQGKKSREVVEEV